MSTQILHEILISGFYSRLQEIEEIISRPGHPGLRFKTPIVSQMRGDRSDWDTQRDGPWVVKSQLVSVVMTYSGENMSYYVGLHLDHDPHLVQSTKLTLREAFESVVREYQNGAYVRLIPI